MGEEVCIISHERRGVHQFMISMILVSNCTLELERINQYHGQAEELHFQPYLPVALHENFTV